MKACVLKKNGRIEVEEKSIPQIRENEVLIKISVCGVCHSELEEYISGSSDDHTVLGHEPVGVVEKTGNMVQNFKPGDRVTGIFSHGFAEYAAAGEETLIKVPPHLRDEEAIIEPWSCLMSGLDRANIKIGDTAAVVGCGYMGLGDLMLAKLCGVSKMIAVDIRQPSLESAKEFGADECWLSQEVPEKYIVDKWDGCIFEKGVDVVFEATGTEAGLELAGKMVKPHGTLVIVGYHNSGEKRRIDMKLWNWKAITVINAHERRAEQQVRYAKKAMDLIAAGKVEAGRLITHCYTPENINQGFQDLKERPENYIKGFVRMG